jgi:glycosyltransferase involved in cell wall biosynthesis
VSASPTRSSTNAGVSTHAAPRHSRCWTRSSSRPRFVAERLVAGGIPAGKIEIVPYAIDARALESVAPVRTDGSQRLRFGFIGGLSKHKGAHVLLEAFERLLLPAELVLFGDSTDREYVERVHARATEVGAVWRGAFDARDLPSVLAEIDVLVVPSLWSENAPVRDPRGLRCQTAGDREPRRRARRERARRRRRPARRAR